MTDYIVYCHHDEHDWRAKDNGEHWRSESRMYGSPNWGGLWHCPQHRHPGMGPGKWRGRRLLTCGCPYDPSYVDDALEATND